MPSGIRADVKVGSPESCPISQVSGRRDTTIDTVSRSVAPDTADTVTEEFVAEDPGDDLLSEDTRGGIELEEVFEYGSSQVYRFERAHDWGCPCECVERFDCPLIDIQARDGSLFLVFHAPDMETLRGVITALRERYRDVAVERLLRSDGDRSEASLVFVDRSELTDRQRESLRTAHRMGYFEYPREANAGEVADELGIATPTFTEHLTAAQRKLLSSILDE
jgi:predicted DNA binding protein